MTTLIPKFDLKAGGATPAGAINRAINLKLEETVSVLDFGADPTGVADSTAAITAAIATGKAVHAPEGIYKYTTLDFSPCPYLYGDGIGITIFKPTAVAGNVIYVGGPGTVANGNYFSDFTVEGNATTTKGIQFGVSQAPLYLALNVTCEKVEVTGFTSNNSVGIWFQCIQDCRFIDCQSTNNNINLYRPDTTVANGFLTTVTWEGRAASLDLATGNAAVVINGEVSTLILREGTIRSCAKSAIIQNVPTLNTNNGNKLILDKLFFENNNTANQAGLAEINIAGFNASGAAFIFEMYDCEMWTQANTSVGTPFSMYQIQLGYVNAYISRTTGSNLSGSGLNLAQIITTANTRLILDLNAFPNGAGAQNYESNIPAWLGQVFISDKDTSNNYRFESGVAKFLNPIYACGSVTPPAGGNSNTAALYLSNVGAFGVFFGSGAPTITAAQGSLYLRTDGSSTSTRMYVNSSGSTTWTAVTTAS